MDISILTTIPLFKKIPEKEIEEILSDLQVAEIQFKKDAILVQQYEACNRLIILISGSVKGEMSAPSGKTVKVEDIYAPNPLAILFLFGKENRFPVQVTARESVVALVISKQSVLKMLSKNETVLKNYLDISADFAARLSEKLHFISFRSIRQKIAMYILNLSEAQQLNTVLLDKTKSALAEYFGVSRQSLEREITNMQQDELISVEKKKIEIINKERLVRLIRF